MGLIYSRFTNRLLKMVLAEEDVGIVEAMTVLGISDGKDLQLTIAPRNPWSKDEHLLHLVLLVL